MQSPVRDMHSYIPLHGPHKARPETVCVSCIISHFEWELGTDAPQGCTRESVRARTLSKQISPLILTNYNTPSCGLEPHYT